MPPPNNHLQIARLHVYLVQVRTWLVHKQVPCSLALAPPPTHRAPHRASDYKRASTCCSSNKQLLKQAQAKAASTSKDNDLSQDSMKIQDHFLFLVHDDVIHDRWELLPLKRTKRNYEQKREQSLFGRGVVIQFIVKLINYSRPWIDYSTVVSSNNNNEMGHT